jgi:hypothetical protein
MSGNEPAASIVKSAKSELYNSMKVVPGAIVISVLWFIVLRYFLDQWLFLAALPSDDRTSLAFFFAAPFALITYYMGNYWDDRVFDPRYTEDPYTNFRGKWLGTSKRNFIGLLPAGKGLDNARKSAAKALELGTVADVYAKSKAELQKRKEWNRAYSLLVLSKLCRSLIWPSLLVAMGLLAGSAHDFFMRESVSAGAWVLYALLSFSFGIFLFVPYINLRVEHLIEVYKSVAKLHDSR